MTQYFYQFLNGRFITVCLVLTVLLHLFLWHLFIQSTCTINANYFWHYCVLQSGRRLSLREREKDCPFQEIQEGTWSEQRFDSHWLLKAIMFSDDWLELLAECVDMIVIFFNKTDNYRKPCVFKRTQRNSTMCENHVLIQIMTGE